MIPIKVILGVMIVLLVLFQLVVDPKYLHWLNIIWISFWALLFIGFAYSSIRFKRKLNKIDKEG